MQPEERFCSLQRAARLLGVPVGWLASEAEAGRVPFVQAGRRKLVELAKIRDALRERAEAEAAERRGEAVHA